MERCISIRLQRRGEDEVKHRCFTRDSGEAGVYKKERSEENAEEQ